MSNFIALTDPEWRLLAALVSEAMDVLKKQGLDQELTPWHGPCWHNIIMNSCSLGRKCRSAHPPLAYVAWYGTCVVRDHEERQVQEISLRSNARTEERPFPLFSSFGDRDNRNNRCCLVHNLVAHRYLAVRSARRCPQMGMEYKGILKLLGL